MSITDALGDTAEKPEVIDPEPTAEAATDAIMDLIMGAVVDVADIPHRRKVLIYSDPGMGKTVLAATAPKVLLHDTEAGAASINNHPELQSNVKVLPFKSLNQFEALVDRMIEGGNALDDRETYVIDTLSNLHKKGLADTTVSNAAKTTGKNQYVAETEDHTENNERIRRIVSKLNALSETRNIIILCHAKKIERKDKSIVFSPDFSDKLTNAINALVDVVGYMYMKEEGGQEKRYIRLRPSVNIVAKTRFGFHPVEMENPTWSKLFPPDTNKIE